MPIDVAHLTDQQFVAHLLLKQIRKEIPTPEEISRLTEIQLEGSSFANRKAVEAQHEKWETEQAERERSSDAV